MEVYKAWQEYLVNFPKTSRFSLGSKIDTIFLQLIEYIFIACCLKGEYKLSYLSKSSAKLDLLKFFIRIAWEVKALDNKMYIVLSEHLDETGRMLGGWIRQLKKLPCETKEQR